MIDHSLTKLILAAGQGNSDAWESIIPRVYNELHEMARHYLRRERSDHTLQPTALVNEIYMRMSKSMPEELQDRSHFFAIAANLMKRVLIDHARRKHAQKRKIEDHRSTLENFYNRESLTTEELLALDEALTRFQSLYPRAGQVVEMRFFCGMTEVETARVLDISVSTLKREWGFAKVWLLREMTRV